MSLAVLLGAFMGGMFAGSLLLPRHISPAKHPLRMFAALEAAIGGCGALLIVVMPLVGRLYTAMDGGGPSSIVLRALASLLLLLPPAMLMGATLPAMSRYVEATPAGAARLGLFYGGNILGAVIGCLSAGFYLLRSFDLATASLAAVFLNAVVASAAFFLAKRTPYAARSHANTDGDAASRNASDEPTVEAARGSRAGSMSAIALSGFTALGAEVVWTRLLSLLFGATTYTFSMILAVFLAGLGAGSALGAALVRRTANPRALLGWVQLGPVVCHRLWRMDGDADAPVLAYRYVACTGCGARLPDRPVSRSPRHASRRGALGTELSSRGLGGRPPFPAGALAKEGEFDAGACRRPRVCRQYLRRNRRCGPHASGSHSSCGNARRTAHADRRLGGFGGRGAAATSGMVNGGTPSEDPARPWFRRHVRAGVVDDGRRRSQPRPCRMCRRDWWHGAACFRGTGSRGRCMWAKASTPPSPSRKDRTAGEVFT